MLILIFQLSSLTCEQERASPEGLSQTFEVQEEEEEEEEKEGARGPCQGRGPAATWSIKRGNVSARPHHSQENPAASSVDSLN